MTRRDFGILRKHVPDRYLAISLNSPFNEHPLRPKDPLPSGAFVRDPGSWILAYEHPFSLAIYGLVNVEQARWYRIKTLVELQVGSIKNFASFRPSCSVLTTAMLGQWLNQEIKDKLSSALSDAQYTDDTDFAQQIVQSALEDALSDETGVLWDAGLRRLAVGDIEWTPIQSQDVQEGWQGPYVLDQRQHEISRLTEGILGLQGLTTGDQPHPVEMVIEGAVKLLQILGAMAGLLAIIWPQLLPWPDMAVHDRVLGLLTTLLSTVLTPLRQWLRRRGVASLLSGPALGEQQVSTPLTDHQGTLSDYRLRADFWERVSHALTAGLFDDVGSSTKRAERIVGRLAPRSLQVALPDIKTLYGDLAVLPVDPGERRAWLMARIWLTRQSLLKLDTAVQQGETPPDADLWVRQLDDTVGTARDSLQKSFEQYRSLGITPKGGILAPQRSSWRIGIRNFARSQFVQSVRNRVSEAAYAIAWILTRVLIIPRAIWFGLQRVFWPLRNRLSSLCLGGLWVVVRTVRHPILSAMLVLVLAGAFVLLRSGEGNAAAHELIERAIARPASIVCAGLANIQCPYQGAQAQRICIWKDLSFCPTATPTNAKRGPSASPPTANTSDGATPEPTKPQPTTTTPPTATSKPVSKPSVPPTPEPTSKPVVRPPAPQLPKCADSRAVITEPVLDAVVTGALVIRGTATHQRFSSYKLELGVGRDPDSWSWMDLPDYKQEPVVNGVLGTWNARNAGGTLKLSPGVYTIRLVVIDQTGNYPEPCRTSIIVK